MGKYILLLYSRIILNIQTTEAKICFRKQESAKKKLTKLKLHLEFNELCIKENLLPTYTNTYVLLEGGIFPSKKMESLVFERTPLEQFSSQKV